MGRFVLIREPDKSGEGHLVGEGRVPKEDVLHKALMHNPRLVPAADLGLGEVATVGYEASLPSAGDADLVLLDEEGRLCLVEVKKAGNPDTRRVIAQLLDYASALWGLSLDEFENRVNRRRLDDHRSLRQFILDELVTAADASEAETEAQTIIDALGETLRTGQFSLVVAAPTIPAGVQRVIEYLNEFGHSIYGLEVSYFEDGNVEAFVPRIAAKPSLGRGLASDSRPKDVIDREKLLAEIRQRSTPESAEAAAAVLDWADGEARLRIRPATQTIAIVTAATGRRLIRLSHGGNIRIGIGALLKWGEGWDDVRANEFRKELASIGLDLDPAKTSLPAAPMAPLADPTRRERFFDLMDEALDALEGS